AQHYSDADVFVLPSLIEAQPMVVIEAMHFAKPVIVTRQMVSAEELVADGENGFIVDADNAADLAGKLARLDGDKALREKLGHNAHLRSQGYGLSAIIDDLEGEYADLLQR
ncbi:MAG TPA: glycosyltransferase, partial [Gammaproteobacteria bacterium]|nr:glycosyltransferase [Gammaproteobacteria bacterium]